MVWVNPGTPKDMGPPFLVRIPILFPKSSMEFLWEWYGSSFFWMGVPLLRYYCGPLHPNLVILSKSCTSWTYGSSIPFFLGFPWGKKTTPPPPQRFRHLYPQPNHSSLGRKCQTAKLLFIAKVTKVGTAQGIQSSDEPHGFCQDIHSLKLTAGPNKNAGEDFVVVSRIL